MSHLLYHIINNFKRVPRPKELKLSGSPSLSHNMRKMEPNPLLPLHVSSLIIRYPFVLSSCWVSKWSFSVME